MDGEEHGLHGRIGNTPADEYAAKLIKNDKDNEVVISGRMNESLDKFIQWKYLNKGEYVIGLEPTTNYTRGKAKEREKDVIKKVAPLSSVKHRLEIDFFER